LDGLDRDELHDLPAPGRLADRPVNSSIDGSDGV
jgi:hypothetical protein